MGKLIEYLTVRNQIRDSNRMLCKESGDGHMICGVIAISKNDKILLIRGRKTGKWSLPKGHVEGQENSEQCAKREMKEETGIQIDAFTYKNDIAKLRVGIYYFYEADEEIPLTPADDSEVIDSGWFSLQDIHTRSMELNVDANYVYKTLQKCVSK